jgi:signal transduction histidine kinase
MPDLKPREREHRRHRKRVEASEGRSPSLEQGVAGAVAELSRSIGADWDASIRRIVQFDAELLRVERVSFWTLSEDTSSIHCDAGYVASLRSFEHGTTLFESDMPEYFAALRTARMLDMHDVRTDPRCRGLRDDYCASRRVTSMLDIPVWVGGRLWGVLCHEHVGGPRHWSDREEDFATSMGQFVASALAAGALTRTEAAAQRAAFLDAFARGLFSLDPREVGARAVAMVVPRLGAAALLWVVNREGVLECVAFKHADREKEAILLEYVRASAAPAHLEHVVRQGHSLLTPDLNQEHGIGAKERAVIERLAFRSAMAVPLVAGGKTFGTMSFAAEHHYDSDDLALAENVADRVAAALENARLYEMAGEAIVARDELLVLAAHELRTPLTALQLRTEHQLRVAERTGDPAERARSEATARDVRRFAALVDHMLDALNIRSQGITLACSPCDLAALVREAVARLASRSQKAGSTISVDSASSLTGRWDRGRLQKVVDVLLDNAVKFGNGAPIAVTVRTDSVAELTVRDRGIGIASDRLSAIFDPFARAVPKEHFGGLGLGLYIAKAIVEAHGGSITVESRPGEGSTFVVRLPLVPAAAT